ncbi:hypothetical protein [Bosea sp. (in: a-proteobacteria)]|jgi:hypothetical protein|uniref:hypothetical protein n=1 Tax=Bosea sp. (in: a-proteobacteria) TaxID=1871050 RepID=UPI002DDC96A6|nr:hypothetical protein [Bosea sp. (in: a-proteobacteria)]HEV2508629.1 hypothetical protein [Bosea sp. (in: a-proteobacteria)]
MTTALARRLEKLETARRARKPRKSLTLLGTEEEVERQHRQALADGRIGPNDPVARIILGAPKSRSAA